MKTFFHPSPSKPAPRSLREAWLALTGLSAVFLFEMLDGSILNVALPTIGRDLHASTAALQGVTGVYSLVFGVLMLPFGVLADRVGRRRIMLVGLALLGAASLATAFVSTAEELIGVRAAMGVAAAMTTPGSMALAFRLFDEDSLRVRATTLISTVGLVGLAVGPAAGGFVLAFAPWQVLLLVNVPIAVLAMAGVRFGIAKDTADGHREPMLDLKIVTRPLVSSGLAYKAAAALATAGLGYLVTLQLQLDWGWPPALAALGLLPQVIVLLAGGIFVQPLVNRVGLERAAWVSGAAVVVGLAVYGLLGNLGYVWVAVSLALVAAGLRVVGVVAAVNVLRGLPESRTTMGAALTDTVTVVASGTGITVVGTLLAVLFTGSIATAWSPEQTAQFHGAVTVAGLTLTVTAAGLVGWGIACSRKSPGPSIQAES